MAISSYLQLSSISTTNSWADAKVDTYGYIQICQYKLIYMAVVEEVFIC